MKTCVYTETTKDLKESLRHTYILSKDMSLVYGHIPVTEGGDFVFYSRPFKFDRRNRTFRQGF